MTPALDTHPRSLATVAPTVRDVRDGLRATLEPADFDRVWCAACARLHVPTDVSTLDDAQLDRLLTEVATQDRLCQVLAMSWRIRCTAARKLTQLGR